MSRCLVLLVLLVGCDAGVKPAPSAPPAPPAPPALTVAAPTPLVVAVTPPPPAPVTAPPVAAPQVLLARIERGPCYGTCPVYSLTVYRDGKVEYVGKNYVKRIGEATGTVTGEQLAALDKLFTDGKYLAYKSSYTRYEMSDASSVTTAYRPLGATSTKNVDHYHGDMHAPESLTKLENGFDTIARSDRWIGTQAERDKLTGRE
ncbi:MAG: DUF6438 domain-containing protein [Kofleriaceae bacterium]